MSCRKEKSLQVQPSADCIVLNNNSPNFKTYEKLCGIYFFESDTFYIQEYEINTNGYRALQITCKANDTNAISYEWFFSDGLVVDSTGAEAIFSFNSDSVSFGGTQIVTISLITISQNNQRDSTAKTIYIKKRPIQWLGEFKGFNTDNPADTFSIFFTRTDQWGSSIACCTSYTIKNLPKGLNIYVKISDIQTTFDFTLNNDCEPENYEEFLGYTVSGPKGFGNFKNGNIVIDYYYKSPVPDTITSIIIQKTFVGIKVN